MNDIHTLKRQFLVYVQELAKGFVEKGHTVTIFCGNDGKSRRDEIVDGVQIIRRGGFYTVYIWAFLYYIFRFRRRFDLVIESENGVPFFTPLYSTKPKILVVHHVHQEVFQNHLQFPLSTIAQFVEKVLTPIVYRNQHVVAVSESTKKDIIKNGIAKEENISIVSPGVDISVFKKTRKAKYPTFIYVGRHKPYKNIDIAIKAFAKVQSQISTSKLIIAGDGENTWELKELARNLGLQKSILFTGKVSEEKKIQLLGSSWAAIQPSSFEGWGITVIEGNACGTPVIASDVKGLRDSVVNKKTGLLVPPKNIDAFAKSMLLIAKNRF
jgi:glycosyltransferase involved in cell wall biosynthesis